MTSPSRAYVDQDSSHVAKLLMLLFVIMSLILCGGSVFGFTALKAVLLDEGVYEELCSGESSPCEAQLVKLDGMFTLAASLFSAWLMPAGLCLRFLGPRVCILSGLTFVVLGSLMFAWAPPGYYTLAYVLIGTGNPLLYISAFNFGKLYPASSNLLLSIFIGCFGFSSVVFYVFNRIHFRYGLSHQEIFLGFSVIPVMLGVLGLYIVPPDPYHVQYRKKLEALAAEGGVANERTPLTKEKPTIDPEAVTADNGMRVVVPLKDRTLQEQVVSTPFVAQSIFFCWGMLHQNFYLGTLGDQIFMFAGNDVRGQAQAGEILGNFALLYPIGCILSILPVGALVRNTSVSTSIFVYCAANLIFSILALVPAVGVQWWTSTVYIVVRVGFFTTMSTYAATIFGFANFSAMFGFVGFLAGMVSLLGVTLSDRALNVDHSFVPVNTLLCAGAVVNFIFPVLIRRYWQ